MTGLRGLVAKVGMLVSVLALALPGIAQAAPAPGQHSAPDPVRTFDVRLYGETTLPGHVRVLVTGHMFVLVRTDPSRRQFTVHSAVNPDTTGHDLRTGETFRFFGADDYARPLQQGPYNVAFPQTFRAATEQGDVYPVLWRVIVSLNETGFGSIDFADARVQ